MSEHLPATTTSHAPTLKTWLAAEPWSRTLVGVVKHTAIFGVTFYSLMRLMGGSEVSVTQAGLTGLFTAVTALLARRSGNIMPAAPLLVMGGATLVVTLIGASTAIGLGMPALPVLGAAAMGGLLGGAMTWMGLRSRRSERALEAGVREERVAPVLIARAELARRIAEYRGLNEAETRRLLLRLGGGAVVVMGALAFPYERVFGTEAPEWVGMLIFFGMWGGVGLAARSASKRGRALAEEHGLVCSACDRWYFSAFGNMRLQKNIEDAGCCPHCGARIITETGP